MRLESSNRESITFLHFAGCLMWPAETGSGYFWPPNLLIVVGVDGKDCCLSVFHFMALLFCPSFLYLQPLFFQGSRALLHLSSACYAMIPEVIIPAAIILQFCQLLKSHLS